MEGSELCAQCAKPLDGQGVSVDLFELKGRVHPGCVGPYQEYSYKFREEQTELTEILTGR